MWLDPFLLYFGAVEDEQFKIRDLTLKRRTLLVMVCVAVVGGVFYIIWRRSSAFLQVASSELVLDSTLPVCHYVDCDDHDEPQCRAVMPLCSDISVALHDSKVLVTLQHVLYLGILAVWSTVTCHMIVHDAGDTHSGLKTRVG